MNSAKPPDPGPTLLRELRDLGARVRPLTGSERELLLAGFKQRVAGRKRRQQKPLVASLAVAAALLGVWLLRAPEPSAPATPRVERTPPPAAARPIAPTPPAHPRSILLGGRGEIVPEPDAVAQLLPSVHGPSIGPQTVELRSGRLSADVASRGQDEPLAIFTPQVKVVVVGTRFSVAVADGVTTVSVEHGRVRVERAERSVLVGPGETLRSDDARLSPPSAPRPPQRVKGLAAENAALARALYDRDQRGDAEAALARLRAYEQRFPQGVLRREVALIMVTTLMGLGRSEEACAYAQRHEAELAARACGR